MHLRTKILTGTDVSDPRLFCQHCDCTPGRNEEDKLLGYSAGGGWRADFGRPRWRKIISRSEIKLMIQMMAIMGAVLLSMTIAATTSFPVVAFAFWAVAVGLLVAFGIVITRNS